jgi:uncharacterized membrane protein
MTWVRRYRLRHYLIHSVWVGPCVGIALALLIARLASFTDRWLGWRIDLGPDAARAVLMSLASAMFTFVVFLASALLIALQLASAQLTPRIIAIVFRDGVTRLGMSLFVFTFTLTTAVAIRIGAWVPALATYLSVYSCIASLAFFLYLIDHIGKTLRPAGALRSVARLGRDVIKSVYPRRVARDGTGGEDDAVAAGEWAPGEPTATVLARGDGVVLACDIDGIVQLARRSSCVLELVPRVGDFLARGDPMFRVYGGKPGAPGERALLGTVAVGRERSLEQDPMFAFRVIVDIASKALSPAINDPTTAVLAVDQLQHLLAVVGRRHLDDERVRDRAGGPARFLFRTPGWDDFVQLAVTEVRQYGCQSIQVCQRLRAMLESLLRTLPEQRAAPLMRELHLLNRAAARSFADPEDQAFAAEVHDHRARPVAGRRGDGAPPGHARIG